VENNRRHHSPYPGLRPFTEAESDLFFGREKHTAQLRSKLERNRFVAVVGSSGSGKSSLVRAGLIGQLRGLGDPDYAQSSTEDEQLRWRVAEMRPGGCPIGALARALVSPSALGPERALLFADLQEEKRREALEGDAAFVAATLRRGPLGLLEVLRETSLPRDTRLLIFVDQFEEIFRFRNEGPANGSPDSIANGRGAAARERWVNEAEAFVALLLAADQQNDLGVHLLLTMRLDYLSDCAVFTGLPEAISASQFLTPRLTREQRCASIVAPARLYGGDVAPDLVNTLLNDAGPESDQLPLLQHCLMRMWTIAQERSAAAGNVSPILTMEHYRDERVGTIKSCLSKHANGVYVDLDKRSARYGKIAETIFRCLTGQTADKPDTRRPQSWPALLAVATAHGNSEEEVRVVVDAFRHPDCCFLTPSLDTELESATPLDISHESLIRNWDKLQQWAKLESGSAEDYRSLEQSARRWKDGRAGLLDRLALESTLRWKEKENPSAEWAARYGGDFHLAMEFLDRSQEAERKRKETERKRIFRRRWYFITTAITVLVVAGCFSYFAYQEAITQKTLREVETQRLIEKTEQLEQVTKRSDHFLELAQRLLNNPDDPEKDVTALHCLSQALRAYPSNAKAAELTRDLLCRKVWCSPLTRALQSESESPLLSATFGPEGQVFAVSSDGNFLSWNGEGSSLVRRQALLSQENPSTADNFVPNKATLAAACFSQDGERLFVISPPTPPSTTARAQVWSWSPQSTSYERKCPSIEVTDPSQYYSIVWSSDGSLLVVISRRDHPCYQVFQYDGRVYHDLQTPFGPGKVAAASFSADDKLLATVSPEGAVRLWDAATLKPTTGTAEVKGSFNLSRDSRPVSLAFAPDDSVLVMTTFGQPIQFLNIRTGELKQVLSLRTQDHIMRLVFTPRQAGKRLAAKIYNGRVEIKDVSALDGAGAEPICLKGVVGCSMFSPDGKKILILSGPYWMAFDTVQVWDTDLQNPMLEVEQNSFDSSAPLWLADLAQVESAPEGRNSDDDEAPQTMEDIRKKYSAEQGGGTYEVIWQRFFPPSRILTPVERP
jgi:WD40 repeat protein/energy-coupling factor transporter ATP-binding protein EcfA2